MRPALFALPALLLSAAVAWGGTPEEDYVAARDAAIAKIKKAAAKSRDADLSKMDQKALADLDRRLQPVVGGLSAKPYPARGKIATDTLVEDDVGFGVLDALRFAQGEGDQQAFVTTESLLTRWLAKPEDWWTKTRKTPPSIDEALSNEEFYTYAIGPDAAFTKTAELPIAKPDGATYAFAMLGGWAQDVGPNPNQEIIVALRKGGKVYIASETAKKYKAIPACEKIWKDAEAKANALYKTYTDSGAKDQKIFDAYNDVNGKADKDYRACYAERTPREAFFPELTREAQAIADRFKGE
ncbi:MAG: hypothetical protein CTY15_01585 [Methylocystis sp.]|nr:MAG: hypothetical protein CTY15_01585 [Methylocystis sp.]